MIITVDDIMSVRPVAQNIDSDARIAPYITEVENIYIIPAIGVKIYKDIDEGGSSNALLMNGGYYNNDTQFCAGIIMAVAYLVYSRFIVNQNINVTPFGVMMKGSEFSTPVSSSTLLATSREAEKIGLEFLRQCSEYIKWSNGECSANNIRTKKFIAIG